jgi:hypothetical protein
MGDVLTTNIEAAVTMMPGMLRSDQGNRTITNQKVQA